MRPLLPIGKVTVSACPVPTDFPEADGTLPWDETTLVMVEAEAGGARGLGFTYADMATAVLGLQLKRPDAHKCDI
ncbi:MAG TPA: hypothetical protein VGJ94_06165 [Syntrophorhabdaceae bacterium]|jgi:hypothetical protein